MQHPEKLNTEQTDTNTSQIVNTKPLCFWRLCTSSNVLLNFPPVEMWSGIKRSLREVPLILRRVDRWTASLSLRGCRVTSRADDPVTPEDKGKAERVRINYWDLYVRRWDQWEHGYN